ncbi:uncharacterized protein [Typha latifolia]|uniref:uncharacterized protein isoform X1 n=1 Tax=Typha latifolia TaxID=4733 RepID=UPI003C2BF71D
MVTRSPLQFLLLLLVSFVCLKARAESSRSVVFIDGSSNNYIRDQNPDGAETSSMLLDEVAAAASVLLGFAPPSSLAADSSSKLNEVLLANPFDRPHAVFLLEVNGIDGADPLLSMDNSKLTGSIFKSRVLGPSKAALELPGEDEVSVVHLDESVAAECNAACLDKELANIADWLGGSYVGSLESVDGMLTLPLASGKALNLHVEKEAQLQFASGLISLFKSVKRGVEVHEDFAGSIVSPSELIISHFTGIKILQEEYGPGDIVQQAMEVFQTALTKSLDLLYNSHEGKIVGVVISKKEPTPHSGGMIDVTFPTRVSRFLEEGTQAGFPIHTLEVLLVRRSLAWITGIILLVSTLIGVFLLVNMPLTRDTLLYSNVKLD